MMGTELQIRLEPALRLLMPTDVALGYCLPTPSEVEGMAESLSQRLEARPEPGSRQYEIAVAELFGGAITTVMRKSAAKPAGQPDYLPYASGQRNGVVIGYPPTLARTLDLARDLVSDIQKGTPADVSRCFPDSEWVLDANGAFRYLILRGQTGGIKLQWRESTDEQSRLVVLVRVYGSPSDTPFRIQLRADKEGGFRC